MAKIAIIGGGISGMCSAYLLSFRHDVTLIESGSYLGGHTHTHCLKRDDGDWNVDTGFIVYNNKTYPGFLRLLGRLGVKGLPTTMSFSVRCEASDLEYNGTSLNSLFAQRRNLLRPSFWRMIRGILRFNEDCKKLLKVSPTDQTLGDFLKSKNYGREFAEWYIRPMAAAVWSTGTAGILDMPIYFLARFFENHGFLNIDDRPQWYTVEGGSKTYADAIQRHLGKRVVLNTPVLSIKRDSDKVIVSTRDGGSTSYDHAIICSHSDDALKMLADPTPDERHVLGSFGWSTNRVTLHTDERILPMRKLAWAAWNYHLPKAEDRDRSKYVTNSVVTYHMNMLQGLKSKESFLVSLNYSDNIDPSKIIKELVYHHPIFNVEATSAQQKWHQVSGTGARTHYAGAYWFNGFHEDGVQSALRAVNAIDPECVL
jgi:predicted NAD/FAD-binding protein